MAQKPELDDRVCVVTGASGGIGGALTVALANCGARVWAAGRDSERLEAVRTRAEGAPGVVDPIMFDLERPDEIETASRTILARDDRVDVLVHAAGTIALGPLESLQLSELDRLLSVNLRAPVLLTQKLQAALRKAAGQIVFVNSLAGRSPSASNVFYAATKRALEVVADGFRDRLTPEVRVTSAFIGRTDTPMQVVVHEWEGRPYVPELLLRPQDVVDVILEGLSAPRGGEVTDVTVRPSSGLPAQ